MAESLAVKYRPKEFEEVVQQGSIIRILTRQLELEQFAHCYLFAGSSGCGKAQPLTSKILTPDGYKLMKDIKIGDLVIDGEGNTTKVLGVYPQGKRAIYTITFSDRSSIEVSDEHLNSVYRYNRDHKQREDYTLTTLELKDFLTKSRFKLRVDTPVLNFNKKSLPIDPYLLGCILGDGNCNASNVKFTSTDKDVLDKVNNILCKDHECCLQHITRANYNIIRTPETSWKYKISWKDSTFIGITPFRDYLVTLGYPRFDTKTLLSIHNPRSYIKKKYPELSDIKIEFNSHYKETPSFIDEIRKLGLLGHNAINKFIPKDYLYSDYDTRVSLLQGLMDTDGEISKEGTSSIAFSSPQLVEDTLFLLRSLGCVVTPSWRKTKFRYKWKNIDEERIGKPSCRIYIHAPIGLPLCSCNRKLERYRDRQLNPQRKIVSIEYTREDECQCIYVQSDCHTYITDNETVTHNTTLGRIFANKINKGMGSPIEIDAASNNGVDNIKNIVKAAQERSIDSKYKIYIIDECHALTNQAWQAFLKCIEEPPAYTIFIFCTTDPQKIPDTIKNRVQRYTFSRISTDKIRGRLEYICKQEGFTNYEESIDYISKIAEGGMRTAISYLDKCAAMDPNLDIKNVLNALGNYSYKTFFTLLNDMIDGNEASVLKIINDFYNEGNDLKLFIDQYLNFCLDVAKYSLFKTSEVTRIPLSMEPDLQNATNFDNASKYYSYIIDKLLNLKVMLKNDDSPRSTIEVLLLQITRCV